jgi:RNA polymerase sigma-70 factor (ECF subfamily)
MTEQPGAAAAPEAAFALFVEPHWAAMTRLARRLAGGEWEDVVQDALVLAWRKRDRFDPVRGSAAAWLLTLTADAARKTHRRRRATVELVDAPASDPASGVDLERALGRLTQRQRLAVELHYFLGLKVDEMAQVMGCSSGTVKSTLSDARRRLRDELGGED